MLTPFTTCSKCGHSWPSLSDFVADANVWSIGYQIHFERLDQGLFFFNHDCGTTLSVPVSAFHELHDGPILQRRAQDSTDCPGHCLRRDDLQGCRIPCECSSVRDILARLRNWPKRR